MRTKINRYGQQSERLPHGHNKIFKRFRPIFEAMLNPRSMAVEWSEPEAAYVPMRELEEELDGVSDQIIDYVCVLTGYTGIGKSTLLHHYYKTSGEIVYNEECLTVPMFLLDRFNVSEIVTRTLRSVRDFLTRKLEVPYNEGELFDFIYKHRADLLFFGQTIPVNATQNDLILALQTHYPEAYALQEVKFLIQTSSVRKITFVIDDLEAQTHDFQMGCLKQLLMVHYGLSRRPGRNYLVHTLFSVRPFTYIALKHQPWFTAYNINYEIPIEDAISLLPMFKARFDYYVEKLKIKNDVDKLRSWEDAYEVLMAVTEKVCDSSDRTLVKLFNQDLRCSLQGLTNIVTNRRWFEKPEAKMHPSVTLNEYRTSPNFLWRALGMGNNTIYTSIDTPIKNLLLNQEHTASDLLATYVYRYLACSEGSPIEFRRATRENFMDIMKLFFDFVTPDSHLLDTAIEVMIDTDIIEEINGNKTCEKHLRLLPRARTLWNMLRHSSIVFELCRDDIHQDFKAGELIKPASALEDSSLWEALANTFQQINATEKEHLREVVAKGMQAVFKNCFGPELVSRVLWQGMRYSTSVYYVEGVPPKIEALILRLYGLVTEAEKMLDV